MSLVYAPQLPAWHTRKGQMWRVQIHLHAQEAPTSRMRWELLWLWEQPSHRVARIELRPLGTIDRLLELQLRALLRFEAERRDPVQRQTMKETVSDSDCLHAPYHMQLVSRGPTIQNLPRLQL